MLLPVVFTWLVVSEAPSVPATPVEAYVAMFGSLAGVLAVVVKIMRDGRRREKGEDSLIEQQRTELLEPMRVELARAREERDSAYADRDDAYRRLVRAWNDRRALIELCLEHNLELPPEVNE